MPSRPLPSTLPPRAPTIGARGRFTATDALLLGSGNPLRLLDLRDDARFRIEEFLGHLRPAAERADREQPRRVRELGRGGDPGDHRAVSLRRPDPVSYTHLRAHETVLDI